MTTNRADVAVIGAGIVGLAHALAATRRGDRVVVFERDERAVGASIRNFGLIWPVGQPEGPLYERALRAREIWLDVAARSGIWCAESGSLHLAYRREELDVLEEYLETTPASREQGCEILSPSEVAEKSGAANGDGLLGALWSPTELNVDPRQAIPAVAAMLAREHGVELRFGTTVLGIDAPVVETTAGRWHADRVFVCGGDDFETLYPDVFSGSGITRCKLQMLRTAPQPGGWRLGPALCSGLTLLHYGAFAHCVSLDALRERVGRELPYYVERRIHVLLSQTAPGELTIGDSHEYGLTQDPFGREEVDEAFLGYLRTFAAVPSLRIAERWQGIYPYLPGKTELVVEPEPGVTVVNGLGGAGMTLSFGLAEENVGALRGGERAVRGRADPAGAAHAKILSALEAAKRLPYDGEAVDQLQHALQCAALARRSGADREVVVAALLHDVGRSPVALDDLREAGVGGSEHGSLAGAWLRPMVGEGVAWLAEQHVPAKRYLVATDPAYERELSETSRRTLAEQGGPMTDVEVASFEKNPRWEDAARLRRWDDRGKDPGARVPPLGAYADDLRAVISAHLDARGSSTPEEPRGAAI